jgi:hypothetical protein
MIGLKQGQAWCFAGNLYSSPNNVSPTDSYPVEKPKMKLCTKAQ